MHKVVYSRFYSAINVMKAQCYQLFFNCFFFNNLLPHSEVVSFQASLHENIS